MNIVKAVLWLFVALCAAVLAICAAADPGSVSDSLEHMVFHMAYVGMLVVLADMTIRYKD